jgi:hypothetical protein
MFPVVSNGPVLKDIREFEDSEFRMFKLESSLRQPSYRNTLINILNHKVDFDHKPV